MNSTRAIRVAAVAVLILGIEWRLVDPIAIADDPLRFAIPWSMLAIMFPVAIGLWAYEGNNANVWGYQLDFLWGVFVGTLAFCAVAIIG